MTRYGQLLLIIGMLTLSACTPTPTTRDATAIPATITIHPATATAIPTAPMIHAATATEIPATNVPTPVSSMPELDVNPAPLIAVQTIVDYYTAINQQHYTDAYGIWAQPNQTQDQFAAGFADTVTSRIRIGQIELMFDTVTVPVTITAVINLANGDQAVQWFAGKYTIQNKLIVAASINAIAPPAQRDDMDAAQVVTSYYAALQQYQYGAAYTLWADNGGASQLSYADFVQHMADAQQTTITTGTVQREGAAGSEYATVPTVIVVTHGDGTTQVQCGTYTLRRAMVPPFEQLGWRITQSDIQPVTGSNADSASLQHLLTTGCTP